VRVIAEANAMGVTGVEMEAIVAAQTAAAVIYDMRKVAQRRDCPRAPFAQDRRQERRIQHAGSVE
jgi:molybdenum cofactor biosynthesis enzyme